MGAQLLELEDDPSPRRGVSETLGPDRNQSRAGIHQIARVAAGRPMWGIDMDENTLAQEANFDALDGISYTKGCYTGQETVARVHFRGHVNRNLRGVQSAAAIPSGAELFEGEKPVGTVKSSVVSPRMGPIGLAMIRREVETGAEVTARWEGGEGSARVREIPFG